MWALETKLSPLKIVSTLNGCAIFPAPSKINFKLTLLSSN